MKKLIILLITGLLMVTLVTSQQKASAFTGTTATIEARWQDAAADVVTDNATPNVPTVNVVVQQSDSPIDFVKDNWIALIIGLFGFVEVVVRLTPSTKDDAAFKWIKELFDFIIPNLKKGGGTHK